MAPPVPAALLVKDPPLTVTVPVPLIAPPAPPMAWLLVNVLFVTVSGPLMLSIAPPFAARVAAEVAAGDGRLALIVVDGAAGAGAAGCLVAGEASLPLTVRVPWLSIAPPSWAVFESKLVPPR